MNKLSATTVRQISSGQVISEIYCVVKELVENAIDAKATRVEVTLQNFGLDKIEVTDNGTGISIEDASHFAKQHFTSKISKFEDLSSVNTYGFRGEGVASICAVADVHLITRTNNDDVARSYVFNHAGEIVTLSYVASKVGSTVQASRLFSNLPVRRHQYRGLRRLQDSLTTIEKLVLSFALAHPMVHFNLFHGMERVFTRPSCRDRQEAVRVVLGRQRADTLCRFQMKMGMVNVETFVPRPGTEEDKRLFNTSSRLLFVMINDRPVEMPEFHKLGRQLCKDVYQQSGNRYPTSVWFIDMPLEMTDVNLDPNKRRVNFTEMAELLDFLKFEIQLRYSQIPKHHDSLSSIVEADPMAWSMGRSGLNQPTEVSSKRIENNQTSEIHETDSIQWRDDPNEHISYKNSKLNESINSPLPDNDVRNSSEFRTSEMNALDSLKLVCNLPSTQKAQVDSSNESRSDKEGSITPVPVNDVTKSSEHMTLNMKAFDSSDIPRFPSNQRSSDNELLHSLTAKSSDEGRKLICTSPNVSIQSLEDVKTKDERVKIVDKGNNKLSRTEIDSIFGSPVVSTTNTGISKTSDGEGKKRVFGVSQDEMSFVPLTKKVRRDSQKGSERRSVIPSAKPTEIHSPLTKRNREEVNFNIDDLRRRLDNKEDKVSTFGNVIGILNGYDACLVREDSDIFMYNNRRALEVQEENRLRMECQLPSMRLDQPIIIKSNQFLTDANLRTLESLKTREISDTKTNTKRTVVSESALLWNGFCIQRLPDGNFELRRAPSAFEHSFETVLSEILSHLASPSPAASPLWRPLSVATHFKNEAVRVARAVATDRMTGEQLEERCFRNLISKIPDKAVRQSCWHGKMLCQKMYTLPTNNDNFDIFDDSLGMKDYDS